MEFQEARNALSSSSLLAGLPEHTLAELLWTADEHTLNKGEVVFEENSPLDDTFAVLVTGKLEVSQQGHHRKYISDADPEEGNHPVLGGFAYFHRD